jgi:hypothetical protein
MKCLKENWLYFSSKRKETKPMSRQEQDDPALKNYLL